MSELVTPFVYNAILERVIDGDTIDVTLDLGFDVKLHKQRCRLAGIDTPESRTRNLEEKALCLDYPTTMGHFFLGNNHKFYRHCCPKT